VPLSRPAKAVYGLGDHTVTLALSALSLVFFYFLTDIAGLEPALAGAVAWVARVVDAFTDPLMGRISDRTRWRSGRRRPWLLIGMLPFGVCFALLWTVPFQGQAAMFAWYTAVYAALSIAMTVLSVPYMALIPEMATDYDERTSLNTWRAALAQTGTIVAAGMKDVSELAGGGEFGFALVGAVLGFWLVLPWLGVHAVSFEPPRSERDSETSPTLGLAALREVFAHRSYRTLSILYLSARAALDTASLAFVYYFTYWLAREQDFLPTILLLFGGVLISLPLWLAASRRFEKHRAFVLGTGYWVALLVCLFFVQPDWPRWLLFAFGPLIGVGYAVADLMPWAMLGEVIDEGELQTGENRAGLYNGVFTFLRKLGGASATLLAGFLLQLAGFVANQPQPDAALWVIRALATLVPAALLSVSIAFAVGYPLTRARHAEIVAALGRRPPGDAGMRPRIEVD